MEQAATRRSRPEAGGPRRPGAHGSAPARHGRPRTASPDPAAEHAHARDRDDRLRHGRDRRGGDEGGRGRFPAEAVLARPPDDGGPQGAGSARAARTRTASCAKSWATATSSTTSSAAARRCRRSSPPSMRVAPTRATVLLAGESGVGKDMIARAIHFTIAAARPAVREDQLHGAAREPDGERAVRLREGRLHRRERRPSPASSSRPTRARCSSTRSATCRRRFR